MHTSLEKREISQALDQDLKEAVSLVKRHDYERMLKHAARKDIRCLTLERARSFIISEPQPLT